MIIFPSSLEMYNNKRFSFFLVCNVIQASSEMLGRYVLEKRSKSNNSWRKIIDITNYSCKTHILRSYLLFQSIHGSLARVARQRHSFADSGLANELNSFVADFPYWCLQLEHKTDVDVHYEVGLEQVVRNRCCELSYNSQLENTINCIYFRREIKIM